MRTGEQRVATEQKSWRSANLQFSLLLAIGVGAILRLSPIAGSPYPLNDGGLFAAMAKDLTNAGFALPATTSYNGEAIPFAYPPLGIYTVAILSSTLHIEPMDVLRWVPPLVSILCIPAMYLLAAELLRSQWRGVVAAGAFALISRSYIWMIVGGGVTRSLGFLLAILAIYFGERLLRRESSFDFGMTSLLGGLTFLAHPQAALFLAVSLAVLMASGIGGSRSVRSLGLLCGSGLCALAVASPWLVAVVAIHGIGPLVSAGQSSTDLAAGWSSLTSFTFADTPVIDLMVALGVLGVILRAARRQWAIPLWVAATVLVDPRAGSTYATVPLALSVVPILGEFLGRMVPRDGRNRNLDSMPMPRLVLRHPGAGILLGLLLFGALRTAARTSVDPLSPLRGLQTSHVRAMEWVELNVPATSAVAVITGSETWETDYLSEWFPVLAEHESIATVQGSEWTGRDAFIAHLASYRQLQNCAGMTVACVTDWSSRWLQVKPFLFLPKGQLAGPLSEPDCCPSLRLTLATSDLYAVVYDGPGATVFAPEGNGL